MSFASLGQIFFWISLLSFGSVNAQPSGYAVASAHPLATQAGLAILAEGGNAFDAAVGVSAVLGVVAPYHSGLGGGGFWLLYDAKSQKYRFVDGREKAPGDATQTMFLDASGKPVDGLSLHGGLAAAIPGEPAALAWIATHYGKLPLKQSLAPAIELAEKGFPVDHQFIRFTLMDDRLEKMRQYPATASVFLKNGQPYQLGEYLKQPDLAKTMRLLASKGHDGFYRGDIAEKLVKAVKETGGIWRMDDLANYQVKERMPLTGTYHQMKIITAPLPSAGGISLLMMLNILEDTPLQALSKVQWVHYLAEAMRLAYWQRIQFLGDPEFVDVPQAKLLSKDHTDYLRTFIKPSAATPSKTLPGKKNTHKKQKNTTHFSIIDRNGNRVAATLTVNYIFGSSVIAAGTGVLLNDQMDDFSIKPGVMNVFGLVGSEKNAIAPGKRPLSSMAPTFLELPGRVAILGTPGGSRIPSMVLLASLAFHDSLGAISMVSKMRFHHQYLPDWLVFEPDTLSNTVQKKLKAMGYQLLELPQYYGDMQAITWDQTKRFLTAASDPRHIGLAAVVNTKKAGAYDYKH